MIVIWVTQMKVKRFPALILCALMMLASFGILAGAAETEPTIDTVANPLMHGGMVDQIAEQTNVQIEGGAAVSFMTGKQGAVKIKVGVPVTGFYNVAALLVAEDNSTTLDNDLILTTDRGESFTYSRTTRGGSWTYAPANVYLEKGDRILTFSSDIATGRYTIIRGVRLYHVTQAFSAFAKTGFEIPLDADSVTATAGEVFAPYIGTNSDSKGVEIKAPGATVIKDSADWANSTITFTEAGEYTLSINDDFFGKEITTTIPVTKELPVDDTEREPTLDTVANPLRTTDFVNQVTAQINTQIMGGASIQFTPNKKNTVKVKVGVPETGYYNVSALLKSNDNTSILYDDLTLTTDRGESFTYSGTTRGDNWTYAPDNLYLKKGDRILTFTSDMVSDKATVLSGVRLYNIKKAFYAIKNAEFEIPFETESVTVPAEEIFATEIGAKPDSSEVVLTAAGAEVSLNKTDWTKSTITFSAEGEYVISIKDEFYGGVVESIVPVTKATRPREETEPVLNTVAEPLMHAGVVKQVTSLTNAQIIEDTSIYFMANQDNTVKIKVGVPETGYYNVSALLKSNDGAAVLYNDLTLTTESGGSFVYDKVTRGGSWTYAPYNVYLEKGNRILTFRANMTSGMHTILTGIRLYHITAAFGAKGDLTYKFGRNEEIATTVTAGDLFAACIGVTDIDSMKVELTAAGAVVEKNTSDWTQSIISFNKTGKYKVKIKDNFFGTEVTANVLISREPTLEVSNVRILNEEGFRIPYAISDNLTPHVNATITKIKEDAEKAYLVVAEYSENGMLMGVSTEVVNTSEISLNESKDYEIPLSLKGNGGAVKTFIIGKDFDPLTEIYSYSSEDIFTKEMLNKEVTYTLATEMLNPAGRHYSEYGIHDDKYDIDAIFYDGSVYDGKQTKIFAYIGIPKTATAEKPVPAVVCVHGGWGKAEISWVKDWNDRGYAAIAMDLYGNGPESGLNNPDDHTGKLKHPYAGMYPWDDYGTAFLTDYDHAGMYHAVQNVINAHSLIRSLDKVDATKTGITGISWGAITTTIVSGVDDRFKFAAPVYGCGYLDRAATYFQSAYAGAGKTDKWDPVNFAATAKMPVLYVNGDTDVHFSINSSSLTYEYTPNAYLSIRHELAHSQGEGQSIEQIYDFAKNVFGGNTQPYMNIENETFENNVLTFEYTAPAGVAVSAVDTYYITSKTLPAGGGEAVRWAGVTDYTDSNGKITVTLPADATFCYASVTDNSGNVVSTKFIENKR